MTAGGARRRQRGFSLFELAVVAVVAGILLTVFLERLTYYSELAERAAMEMQLRHFKKGLQIQLAELMMTHRQGEAGRLEIENPTQWLADKPSNYAGDYAADGARGYWYFDGRQRELVYLANNQRFLQFEAPEEPRELRFQARLVRDTMTVGGQTVESVTGVALVPVRPYRWSAG